MTMFLFARFHASEGGEAAVERALVEVVAPSREETGCIEIHAYRSTRDSRLFYIHSRWKDEASFEIHAALPHTVHFMESIESLVDQPVEVSRANRIS